MNKKIRTTEELLNLAEIKLAASTKLKNCYDYRDVFTKFTKFCEWRNEKLVDPSYKYRTEAIDENGDLIIYKDELLLFIEENREFVEWIVLPNPLVLNKT